VLPQFALDQATGAIRERRAEVTSDAKGEVLLGYAGVLIGGEREELRPSRTGTLFVAYDLKRYKAEARAQVLQHSLYWPGWVTALALAMWLVFHFLLTRRTARLVHAAEELAAGDLTARSGLSGNDELGRLGRAFDAMALDVAETQTRLRQDLAERARVQRELENSEARLQQILNNATAVIYVKDIEGRLLFVNRQWERLFHKRLADVVGKMERETLPEDTTQAFRNNDLLVLQRNAAMEFEETAPLDDGAHTYISIKFPLQDANGKAYAVCGISTDITERKRSDGRSGIGGKLSRDFRRRRGFDFRARHRDRRDRRRQSQGLRHVWVHPRGFRQIDVGMLGTASDPTQEDAMALMARAAAVSTSASNGMAGARTAPCAGTKCSSSESPSAASIASWRLRATLPAARPLKPRCGERRAVPRHVQCVDRWSGSVERRRRDRRYQSGPLANVRVQRERVHRAAARQLGKPCYHLDFLRAVAAGESLHSEVTEQRKDGSALELEVHGIPMQYQGQPHVRPSPVISRTRNAPRRSSHGSESRCTNAKACRARLAAGGCGS
jgi:PAS domain S-box-containing protein